MAHKGRGEETSNSPEEGKNKAEKTNRNNRLEVSFQPDTVAVEAMETPLDDHALARLAIPKVARLDLPRADYAFSGRAGSLIIDSRQLINTVHDHLQSLGSHSTIFRQVLCVCIHCARELVDGLFVKPLEITQSNSSVSRALHFGSQVDCYELKFLDSCPQKKKRVAGKPALHQSFDV